MPCRGLTQHVGHSALSQQPQPLLRLAAPPPPGRVCPLNLQLPSQHSSRRLRRRAAAASGCGSVCVGGRQEVSQLRELPLLGGGSRLQLRRGVQGPKANPAFGTGRRR
jgi:hypothetical protein